MDPLPNGTRVDIDKRRSLRGVVVGESSITRRDGSKARINLVELDIPFNLPRGLGNVVIMAAHPDCLEVEPG